MNSTKDANNTKNVRSRSVTFHLTNLWAVCLSRVVVPSFADGHAIDYRESIVSWVIITDVLWRDFSRIMQVGS